jgi:hypothetical protein
LHSRHEIRATLVNACAACSELSARGFSLSRAIDAVGKPAAIHPFVQPSVIRDYSEGELNMFRRFLGIVCLSIGITGLAEAQA